MYPTFHRGSFQASLALGKETEELSLKYIQKKYPSALIREGLCKEYDIYIPELDKSIEIKRDIESYETGNFAIEYMCNGKPSGVSATQAYKWFIFSGMNTDMCLSIKVDTLKELCHTFSTNRKTVTLDSIAKIILVPTLSLIVEADILRLK